MTTVRTHKMCQKLTARPGLVIFTLTWVFCLDSLRGLYLKLLSLPLSVSPVRLSWHLKNSCACPICSTNSTSCTLERASEAKICGCQDAGAQSSGNLYSDSRRGLLRQRKPAKPKVKPVRAFTSIANCLAAKQSAQVNYLWKKVVSLK